MVCSSSSVNCAYPGGGIMLNVRRALVGGLGILRNCGRGIGHHGGIEGAGDQYRHAAALITCDQERVFITSSAGSYSCAQSLLEAMPNKTTSTDFPKR